MERARIGRKGKGGKGKERGGEEEEEEDPASEGYDRRTSIISYTTHSTNEEVQAATDTTIVLALCREHPSSSLRS